jgi:hypothetical protein
MIHDRYYHKTSLNATPSPSPLSAVRKIYNNSRETILLSLNTSVFTCEHAFHCLAFPIHCKSCTKWPSHRSTVALPHGRDHVATMCFSDPIHYLKCGHSEHAELSLCPQQRNIHELRLQGRKIHPAIERFALEECHAMQNMPPPQRRRTHDGYCSMCVRHEKQPEIQGRNEFLGPTQGQRSVSALTALFRSQAARGAGGGGVTQAGGSGAQS